MKILVIDDDPIVRTIVSGLLAHLGHEAAVAENGELGWNHLLANDVDVVICDWQMPQLSGVDLSSRIRNHPEILYPYFILLTVRDEYQDVLTSVRAGVDDHLSKPLDPEVLEARLIVAARVRALHKEMYATREALEAANTRLEDAAHHDALTGLGNRLLLNTDLPSVQARFMREGYPYSVALFDIDHFKAYNDSYGHQKGDALLASVGAIFASSLRKGDSAYRYGGEEFLVVFPNRTLEEATQGAERLRILMGEGTGLEGLPEPICMSCGIACAEIDVSIDDIVGRADTALYRAKTSGRNRLVSWTPGEPNDGARVE